MDNRTNPSATEVPSDIANPLTEVGSEATLQRRSDRNENRRWWLKLFLQPLLFLACGVTLIVGLGLAQRWGWISAGGPTGHSHSGGGAANVSYICPMMCTPPQSEPGRCPVCAMELVPATAGAGEGDRESVQIDPAARRIANIRTVTVTAKHLTRTIRAVGDLRYNEGSLKTISAYVDGRLEKLYADFTGIVVQTGDQLALVYSPRLYSAQVEYLLAKRARHEGRASGGSRFGASSQELFENARQQLIELGMTASQIEELEQSGKASSRLHLNAPNNGTVIEKLAVEGQYVKEGDPIYRLADLATVWLMLRLFPEDAAAIRYGQQVEAEVQSLPGRQFTGRVAFVDPRVDPKTRTVGVRVVIPNDQSLLRAGDFARATIEVAVMGNDDPQQGIYDPELANRWISPRHPHVIETSPGRCRECGVSLVSAAELGFTDQPTARSTVLMVPRDAVLMAGGHSVLYVETEPGRFEIRQVTLGPTSGDLVAIIGGVVDGEQVAARGNFLIDSQMQLAGNPSLIDPTKALPAVVDEPGEEIMLALAELTATEREAALRQKICPVAKFPLGSMGAPPKVQVGEREVFICCEGCRKRLLDDPDKYLANLPRYDEPAPPDPKITAALAKLSAEDREAALRQKICPVAKFPLGSMGAPPKVQVGERVVFICCEGCRKRLLDDPDKYLANLAPDESSNRNSLDSSVEKRGETLR